MFTAKGHMVFDFMNISILFIFYAPRSLRKKSKKTYCVEIGAENVAAWCFSNTSCFSGTNPGPDQVQQELDNLKEEFNELQTQYNGLQTEYQRLLTEHEELKEQQRKSKFTYKNLENHQIRALAGVPSCAAFMWLLSLVCLSMKSFGKMCRGDQLLLVLMKLKLNLTNFDLAIRFNICPTQVSRILKKCVPVMAAKFKFLIKWPGKGTILKNLPRSFRPKFRACRVIIDCTEVFIQRPSNLDTRAKTYSNYKNHNTMKFLVGITPYGAISFLSKCYGGRISDKELTAKSGFYNKLEYGDLVMADRGFLIEEELSVHGASLAIPPFTRGKKQLSQREVESARRLSRSRIHVERAIERIKNFQILKHVMPISLIHHADSIVTICGALTNLLPKLVK